MTKSLTLLGNFSEGKNSNSANRFIGVLECVNNIWNHTLDRLDEFHWKKYEINSWTNQQTTKSLALLERPLHDCSFR